MSPQRALLLYPDQIPFPDARSTDDHKLFSVTIKLLRVSSLFFPRVIPKAQKMMDALWNPNSSMTSSYRSCEKKNDSV